MRKDIFQMSGRFCVLFLFCIALVFMGVSRVHADEISMGKVFGATTIPLNSTTTLTININNDTFPPRDLSEIAFSDTMPAGLSVSVASTNCVGGTVTYSSTGLALSGAWLAAGRNSCYVYATVQGIAPGLQTNTTSKVTFYGGGVGAPASATITVVSVSVTPPTASLNVNATQNFTATVNPAESVTWSLSGTNCSGAACGSVNPATTASGVATTYTAPAVAPGGTVTLSATTPDSITGAATITIINPAPILTKAFGAATIPVFGTTSLTFTIKNPSSAAPLTGLAFADTFPVSMVVAASPGLNNNCGGTATATPGSPSMSLSGASLAPSASCTVSLNVTGTAAGVLNNTSSSITSANGATGNPATATITVIAPPAIMKSFDAPSIPLNQTSVLTITITNSNPTLSLNGVGFTDTMPSGLGVVSALSSCTGTLNSTSTNVTLTGTVMPPNTYCFVSVTAKGATAGLWTNTTGAVTSTNGGTGNTASASITVVAPPAISKAFGAQAVLVGNSTTLSFTITNPNSTVSLSGVGFTDPLPGLLVAKPNGLTGSCGGGTITAVVGSASISLSGATLAESASCSFTVNVSGATVGPQVNTTSAVTSTEGGTGNTASAQITVLAPALTNYFSNAHGSAPDATMRITNPGTSGGNICADIFVFDATQELSECCSCVITPDDLLTLSVNIDVTGNPLTGTFLSTGFVEIIPAAAQGGLCPVPMTLTSKPALRAWTTHLQKDGSSFVPTETESSIAGISLQNIQALESECVGITEVGSGHGVCANSAALSAICNR